MELPGAFWSDLERAVAEGAGCKRSEKRWNSVDVSRRS